MLCLNDSFFFLKPIIVSKKKKKKKKRVWGWGGGGGGVANVRSLRLKNWLPLESILYIRLLDHNTLKICYFVNLDHSFY